MRIPRIASLFSLAAAVVLAAGCETAQTRVPRETQTVALVPGKPVDVKLETVTAVRFVLPRPVGGLEWVLASNNRRVIDQMGPLKPAADSQATEITFYALEPGRSTVRFFLVRPEDKDATPAATCVATVDVDD